MTRKELKESKRIVVKLGSSLLDRGKNSPVPGIVKQIKTLTTQGRDVVLVSSGAVYFGTRELGWDTPPETLPQKQALASVGQPLLMNHYHQLFQQQNLITAQVLLTQDGIHNRETYLNAFNTMNSLMDLDVVPIVNENDTVATEELQFGNNDVLAALVSTLVDSDLLVILSDVEGLYPGNPEEFDKPVHKVESINQEIRQMAQPAEKGRTTVGGMITKIEAAETVTQAGRPMIIGSGHEPDILPRLIDGENLGTIFLPRSEENAVRGRKRWIGYHLPIKGTIRVDRGAKKALQNRGTSLLPSGIQEVRGNFERGDTVRIVDQDGNEFARGLTNYNTDQINRLKGCQTDEIFDILGVHDFDEIIHRDNLVILTHDTN